MSQILLLHKTRGYYNKIDSTKSVGAYYWYVKYEFVEHGFKDIAFYVQKHIAHQAVSYNFPLVRDKPCTRGVRICETRLLRELLWRDIVHGSQKRDAAAYYPCTWEIQL